MSTPSLVQVDDWTLEEQKITYPFHKCIDGYDPYTLPVLQVKPPFLDEWWLWTHQL